MGEAETTAQGVAQLVVERHAHGAERYPRKPGTIERFRARLEVAGLGDHGGQAGPQGANPFLRHERDDRVRRLRVESFHAMGDRVHTAGTGNAGRQTERQVGIIDDGFRQNAPVAPRSLHAIFSKPPDRRHFGTGVGCGHRQDRQLALEGDRFTQADRGASAHRNAAIGVPAHGLRDSGAGALDGHMHYGAVVNPDAARAQAPRNLLGLCLLLGRAQHQRLFRAQGRYFVGDPVQSANGENDPRWQGLVSEIEHRAPRPRCQRRRVPWRFVRLDRARPAAPPRWAAASSKDRRRTPGPTPSTRWPARG